MTAVNQVGNALTGSTGTGLFVGATSPALVLPTANNFLAGFSTTATAAGTTVLTVSSNQIQEFTGATTQTVTMPVTSTLTLGQQYYIINNSSGIVTVQSSGANTIQAMASGSSLLLTCILTSGTGTASWQSSYLVDSAGVTSITGTANQVIASSPTGNVTLSLPQSIATTSSVTFGSVTFSPTTQGIVGTTTSNSASTGYVGEFVAQDNSGSPTALTTLVNVNLASISLTAGDWDVTAVFTITPAPTTTVVYIAGSISLTTGTYNGVAGYNQIISYGDQVVNDYIGNVMVCVPSARISLAATTTIYAVGGAAFGVSTCQGYAYISARRVR